MKKNTRISQIFEADHDRLDGLFGNFQKYKANDFLLAREYFIQFKFGLLRHILWEEDILFPFFERKTGNSFSQPVQVMRLEHRNIARLMETIHNKIREGDPNSAREEEQLLSFLRNHNTKEENILYPSIDRCATLEDVDWLFQAINQLPEEKYDLCPERLELQVS